MIKTQDLEKIIALSLYSAHIKDEKAVSLMVVSDRPESGKSEAVNRYYGNRGLAYVSDCTAYGLWRDFHKEIQAGKLSHLIIPEFLAPLSRNKDTVSSFIATLQMLIEEGMMEIHTGFLDAIKLASPVSIGCVICMPRTAYERNITEWRLSGFASRFVIASYSYDSYTVDNIFNSIRDREYIGNSKLKLDFPAEPVNIDIPPDIADEAMQFVKDNTETLRRERAGYGFREFKNLLRLLQANVIMANHNSQNNGKRVSVNKNDLDEIKRISYLINEKFNILGGE